MSDSILVRVAAGECAATHECIAQYSGLVWSIARRMTKSLADAEDAVQEIFVELWRSAANFDPSRATEATYIAMIARRRLIDQFRKRSKEPDSVPIDSALEISDAPSTSLDDMDEYTRVREHMADLREEEKQVIELSVLEGFSQTEISQKLSMPLGTVKTNARRGMRRLRELVFSGQQLATGGEHE